MPTQRHNLRRALWALIFLGLCASLYGAFLRGGVEFRNREVAIALDFEEVRRVSAAQGVPLGDGLRAFKDAGATSILLAEDTIAGLGENRTVEVVSTSQPDSTYLAVHHGNYRRIVDHFRNRTRLILKTPPGYEQASPQDAGLVLEAPYDLVANQGIGLDPDSVKRITDSGLQLIGRVGNTDNISESGIAWALGQLKQNGAHTVIFSGDSVLGNRDRLKVTAKALQDLELDFGAVEFSKQRGDSLVAREAADRVVRVHTITGAEMVSATPGENIARFRLAVRERNIRVALVRLFLDESEPLTENAAYVKKIVKAATADGIVAGPNTHGFDPLQSPWWLRALIGIGVGAGLILLIDSVTGCLEVSTNPIERRISRLIWLCGACVPLLAAAPMSLLTKAVALLAGCVFPALAVVRRDILSEVRDGKSVFATIVARLFSACAVTLIGVAAIVGLLADRLYLIKADSFLGVKLTLAVPVAIAAIVYGLDLSAESLSGFGKLLKVRWEQGLKIARDPVRLWQILAAVVALGLLALVLMRSGNDPGIGVSESELRLRSILDRVFGVRPRFKDIFGHPAMILSIWLALRGRRTLALPFFVIGVVAQTSLLNTFCHLHTPLYIAAWRDAIAVGLGLFFGAALIGLWTAVERKFFPGVRR